MFLLPVVPIGAATGTSDEVQSPKKKGIHHDGKMVHMIKTKEEGKQAQEEYEFKAGLVEVGAGCDYELHHGEGVPLESDTGKPKKSMENTDNPGIRRP